MSVEPTEWDTELYRQAQADIRWAKERSWTVAQYAIVLLGGILALGRGSDTFWARAWWFALATLVAAYACVWLLQLHSFAAKARTFVDTILANYPQRKRYPADRGADRHHGRHLIAHLGAVIVAWLSVVGLLIARQLDLSPGTLPNGLASMDAVVTAVATVALALFAAYQAVEARRDRKARVREAQQQKEDRERAADVAASAVAYRLRRQLVTWGGEEKVDLRKWVVVGYDPQHLETAEQLVVELIALRAKTSKDVSDAIDKIYVRFLRGAHNLNEYVKKHGTTPSGSGQHALGDLLLLREAEHDLNQCIALMDDVVISPSLAGVSREDVKGRLFAAIGDDEDGHGSSAPGDG